MKKFLAKLMAVVMAISLLPAYVFAADGDTTSAVESIGSPIVRTQLVSYVITEQDGNSVMVGVSSGTPAHLMVVDLKTREVLGEHEIEYGSTFYAYAKDSKGDVYFAGYSAPVKLYKYSVTTKTVTELASTSTNGFFGIGAYEAKAICDIAVDDEDNVYLATYPESRIMKWNGSSLSNVTSIYTDDDYLKSLAYYNGCLYAGGNKEGTYLVEYNLSTGKKTNYQVSLPEGVTLKSMYQSNVVGDRLFIFCYTVSSGYHTAIFDLTNKVWKDAIADSYGSYAIPAGDGNYAYLVKGARLQKYDLQNDTYETVMPNMAIGGIRTKDNAMIDGVPYIVYTPSNQSYISLVNLQANTMNKYDDVLPKYPDMLESFMLDSNGDIYASVYQGGVATKYDPYAQEVLESFSVGQASAIAEIDGKIYFGTYPQADLCVYDPTLPVSSTNPKQLFAMPEENQARPMEIIKAGDKLVMSAVGGYGDADGKSTGYIVVYDTTTGKYIKYKGGVMENYHMVGLYYDAVNGMLYVTTTVVGGHNSTQVHNNAVIFQMFADFADADIEITENQVTTFDDDIENTVTLSGSNFGKSTNIAMCGGLLKDTAEDKLWSACYNGIFSIDLETLTIGDCISIDDGPASMSRWQPYQLEFNSEGFLYATPSDKLVKVNTEDLTYEKIAEDVFDMALFEGSQGTAIYTLKQKDTVINVINKQPEVVKPELVDGYYQIKSFDDFLYIEKEPTAKYKLMNDITVGTADAPFTAPFGFSGEFDGNGKTIDVNIQAGGSVGLFSSQPTYNGKVTIKNLTLTGSVTRTDVAAANTTINGSVGAFIGYTENQTVLTIENCINKASVNGGAAGYHVGGIVGRVCGVQDSVIKNTKNYGTVTASQGAAQVGGLAGMFSGTITESANGGKVIKTATSNYYTGGLVGEAVKEIKIEKSANFGNVVTPGYAGGLIGRVYDLDQYGENFTVENSFNAGAISGGASGGGASGIVGGRADNGTVVSTLVLNNVYNVGVISGARTRTFICISGDANTTTTNSWVDKHYSANGGSAITANDGVGNKTKLFSSVEATLAGVGFDSSIWTWDKTKFDYPYITSVGIMPNGTASLPYEIRTYEDFLAIKNDPSAYYKLMNDITVGTEAAPFTEPFEFSGVLDGNGKTINAYIKGTGVSTGLFSKQTDASKGIEIKNLTLKGRVERTDTATNSDPVNASVGGFLGYNVNYGKLIIENCVNEAEIVGNAAKSVGGFVGYAFGFTETAPNDCVVIKNSTNKGSVSADYQGGADVGGFMGLGSGTVKKCVNLGTLSGKNEYIGGIIGKNMKSADIEKCVNLGTISTSYSFGAGGIIGIVWDSGVASIKNSYNAGNINNTYTSNLAGAGGLVGRALAETTTATIEDCYTCGTITCGYAARGNQIAGYFCKAFTAKDVWYVTGSDADISDAKAFGTNTTLESIGFDSSVWTWDTSKFDYPYITEIGVFADGSEKRPFEIKTFEDFLAIKNAPSAYYKLMNDITVGTEAAPFTEPFEFRGVLDGNGKTINAYIKGTGIPTGLFSKQSNASKGIEIKNLTLKGRVERTDTTDLNSNLSAVGGFLGYNENYGKLIIDNCVNEAEIVGNKARHVGGFVGYTFGFTQSAPNDCTNITNSTNKGSLSVDNQGNASIGGFMGTGSGTVKNCINMGTISGVTGYAGGILGKITRSGEIIESVNFGKVSVTVANGAGGIAGVIWDGAPVIKDCFNAGDVTNSYNSAGYSSAGGLVGRALSDTTAATFENCYNSGTVSCGYAANGGQIAGQYYGAFTAQNVYYVSGTNAITGASVFGDKNTLEAIGFSTDIWSWDADVAYAYPLFKDSSIPEIGTDNFPYIIETKEEFMAIKDNPTASYYLANDIDLGSYEPFVFKGHLFGKVKNDGEYTAINVNINLPETMYAGLFSQIDGYVRIENIKVTGSINALGVAGGFVGYAGNFDETLTASLTSGSYIKNCVNEANVTVNSNGNTASYAGRAAAGFVGYYRDKAGRNLTFTNLENRGDITAEKSYAGGILGNTWGVISNCVNKGTITGDSCVGGISGYSYDNRPITNCYNTGDVIGNESVAGIVGRWQHPGANSVIQNCYNTGDIIATDVTSTGNFGSFIGNVMGNGTPVINGAYNTGSINGNYINKPCGTAANSFTLTNVIELTVDGDTDSDAQTVGIAGLEAITTELGTGFAASVTDYKFPQIVANINNEALELVMLDKLTLNVQEDGSVTASADIATNLTGKSVTFMLGIYNGDKLVKSDSDIKAINKNCTEFECSETLAEGETVKLLVWDGNMTPYCDPTVYPVVEDEVPEA